MSDVLLHRSHALTDQPALTLLASLLKWFRMLKNQVAQKQLLSDYMYLASPLSPTSMRFYVWIYVCIDISHGFIIALLLAQSPP